MIPWDSLREGHGPALLYPRKTHGRPIGTPLHSGRPMKVALVSQWTPMSLPCDFHASPMRLWCCHRTLMGLLTLVGGFATALSWDAHGFFVRLPGALYGLTVFPGSPMRLPKVYSAGSWACGYLMEFIRHSHGTPMRHPWAFGGFIVFSSDSHGAPMGLSFIRVVHRTSMGLLRKIHGNSRSA